MDIQLQQYHKSNIFHSGKLPIKAKVYLHQFNQAYDEVVFIPLSIGMIKASCLKDDFIVKNFDFGNMIFYRDNTENILSKYINNDISAFSVYVWNERISLSLAKQIKEKFGSIVIFGGPNIPNDSEGLLRQYPFIDYLVHGEGEISFVELLKCIKNKSNLLDVNGISFLNDGVYYKTPERKRITSLNDLPSPFLDNTFEELYDQPYKYQAIWETDRGCPFQCTFCYWGSNIGAKVATFDIDRLQRELDWMVSKKIEYIFLADANFGMLARDVQIADMIVKAKQDTGCPQSVFSSYAKNSGDKVFQIAKKFHDAGLSKGTTLSLQSLNPIVLESVKRSNIKMSVYKELHHKYMKANIPSYTELIVPLPEETLQSFIDGLEQVVEHGEHDQIFVYLCRLLPNTEMSSKESVEKYQYKTKLIPILTHHANVGQESIGEQEYEEIIIATSSMSEQEVRMAVKMSWMFVSNICLKTSYFITMFLFHELGLKVYQYMQFIIESVYSSPDKYPLIYREQVRFDNYLNSLLVAGTGEMDYSEVEYLSPIRWPPEELFFIVCSTGRQEYYSELKDITTKFIKIKGVEVDPNLINELFIYQKNMLIGLNPECSSCEYNWDFYNFFINIRSGCPEKIKKQKYLSNITSQYKYESLNDFIKYHVWQGRRRRSFYYLESYKDINNV